MANVSSSPSRRLAILLVLTEILVLLQASVVQGGELPTKTAGDPVYSCLGWPPPGMFLASHIFDDSTKSGNPGEMVLSEVAGDN